jgi:hypothetical protein
MRYPNILLALSMYATLLAGLFWMGSELLPTESQRLGCVQVTSKISDIALPNGEWKEVLRMTDDRWCVRG